jgi:hypothetical protein
VRLVGFIVRKIKCPQYFLFEVLLRGVVTRVVKRDLIYLARSVNSGAVYFVRREIMSECLAATFFS